MGRFSTRSLQLVLRLTRLQQSSALSNCFAGVRALAHSGSFQTPLGSVHPWQQQQQCSSVVQQQMRSYGSNRAPWDDEVDRINEKFAEAREEIEIAKEDAESIYFNESVATAREAVQGVLDSWEALLGELDQEDKAKLQRAMGLKMEQLKAELKELDELHA